MPDSIAWLASVLRLVDSPVLLLWNLSPHSTCAVHIIVGIDIICTWIRLERPLANLAVMPCANCAMHNVHNGMVASSNY